MNRKRRIHVGLGIAGALAVVLTLVIGVHAFVGGNIGKARRIAAQLQADALAHPNSLGTATPSVESLIAAPAPAALTAGTTSTPRSTAGSSHASTPRTAPSTTLSPNPSTSTAGVAVTAPAPKITQTPVAKTVSTSTIAPWRQPTTAEVNEAIVAVHNLVPFFTPTATQIATSGIQVCEAFDEGQSFSTVEADALSMIGATSYSWAIPQSAQVTAIETLVALYCPANASKLS